MLIKFIHKATRNQLVCERSNGSTEIADIGPGLPAHDLAHYVVEKALKLKQGFYGNIYRGLSVKQLSEKETIRNLDIESGVSEITTRALQSLGTGACTIEQFTELIYEEFKKFLIEFRLPFTEDQILALQDEYLELILRYEQLSEGEALTVYLDMN